METTYQSADGTVSVDSQGVTLSFHPNAGKGSKKIFIAYAHIESVSFLNPGPAAPGYVTFHVPGGDNKLTPEKDRHCVLVASPEDAAAAREYVTAVRSKMAGRSATPEPCSSPASFMDPPRRGPSRNRDSSPARQAPPGVPHRKKSPTGQLLRDLEWPQSPTSYTSAHGYYWSEKERQWVRDPSARATRGERAGMAFAGVCLLAVVVAGGAALVQFFGWLGSEDDGRCAQLSGWYADNPGDSNPNIAEDYASACGAVPPPVANGELVERDGDYVYP